MLVGVTLAPASTRRFPKDTVSIGDDGPSFCTDTSMIALDGTPISTSSGDVVLTLFTLTSATATTCGRLGITVVPPLESGPARLLTVAESEIVFGPPLL